ncbi:hypothetical protein [Enterobacter bugandensis]|uniref:hypothetical protein n=1 Tax=Enterobacter bugandensis TaxID=881260 RepID=UPI00200688AE|nr:hypothetical protein [Enterobacter bugandensis]MCK7435902.1 hypothetical protein [Enterobacter bugandensis]
MNVTLNDVLICSTALLELGSRPINSFDEDNEGARLCSNLYGNVRDEQLRQHPWNFAKKRVTLVPVKDTPAFGYANAFQLPSDFIRLLEINGLREENGIGFPPGYALEQGKILANVDKINLRYVFRNASPNEWDSGFVRVVILAMKKSLAYAITRDAAAVANANQEWAMALRAAKQANGMEVPAQQLEGNAFIEARY